jgi:hypothetical protein
MNLVTLKAVAKQDCTLNHKLINGTYHLPCLSHEYCSGRGKKFRNALVRCNASSRHITKLEQSRFSLDINGLDILYLFPRLQLERIFFEY